MAAIAAARTPRTMPATSAMRGSSSGVPGLFTSRNAGDVIVSRTTFSVNWPLMYTLPWSTDHRG
jgi:hypothetical protein